MADRDRGSFRRDRDDDRYDQRRRDDRYDDRDRDRGPTCKRDERIEVVTKYERKKAAWPVLSVLRRGPADAAGPRTAPVEKQIHLGYMPDKSKYMYLGRFLRVTLNTYQDTSRYMYLGRFVAIHQDTSGYKIKIHVSWLGTS